jgi:hypothetical protein
VLFCGVGNHVDFGGLPGGPEGIQTSDLPIPGTRREGLISGPYFAANLGGQDLRIATAGGRQRVFVDVLVGLTKRAAVGGRSPAEERLPNEAPSDGAPERRCIDDTPKISPIV